MRRIALIVMLGLLAGGCGLSMTQQRKYKTYGRAELWTDGSAARPLPEHVVAQGDIALHADETTPPRVTRELLARGRERFNVFCAPCHGLAGDGDGIIVAHGFPRPPSYHDDHLLAAPAGHFYDVITRGYGVMYAYADRIAPRDRWAIVAYVRALQLSRHATVADVPDAQERLR